MLKGRFLIASLTVAVLVFCSSDGVSQSHWDKWPGNPVFPGGLPGTWDEFQAVATTVMFHENVYKMWYEGVAGFGYATSPDGLDWTRDAGNPILEPGGSGSWDENSVANASVLFVNNAYRMWYSGQDAMDDNRISHATSPDGIDWTKTPATPVLDLGDAGSWDDQEVIHPCVIFEGGMYRMWYNGHDGTTQRILYAYSTDGLDWTRYTLHPMLEPGQSGEWDDFELGPMCVLHADNVYHMWYTAFNQLSEIRIGHATSPDGLIWVKDSLHNPVLGPGDPSDWDDAAVAVANVLPQGNNYVMWYGGTDGMRFQTGYATSSVVTSIDPPDYAGRGFTLAQNHPNPFNPGTTIQYDLPEAARVSLHIYDVSGRTVRRLLNGELEGPGPHEVQWYGRDELGRDVASGVYFYRLEAGAFSETKRMTFVK